MPTYAEHLKALSDYLDKDDASFSKIAAGFTGIAADVKFLKDKITELQNSAGQVTPADQVLIDQLQARVNAASTRTEQLATDIKALDDATPPPDVTTPPSGPPTA